MKELIIHIGFGKCASSSVQNLLTKNAVFTARNIKYRYVGFNPDGSLIDSDRIKKLYDFPPRFFTSNISSEPRILKTQLNSILKDKADVGIISNEGMADPGWLTSDLFECFSSLNIPIKVFLITRRYDTWLNSSWWQWGAFSGLSVDDWLSRFSLNMFRSGVQPWLNLPNLQSFDILDISENPLEEFASSLGLYIDDNPTVNHSTTADMMWFIIKNKFWIKREIHNPQIEFILNEELNYVGEKPQSVISFEEKKLIQKEYQKVLSSKLEKKLHDKFSKHLVELNKELNNFDPSVQISQKFSMDDFLNNHHPSLEFLTKLNDLLAKRLQVPEYFSAARYLAFNPDVNTAGDNPYEHYLKFGIEEGRRI